MPLAALFAGCGLIPGTAEYEADTAIMAAEDAKAKQVQAAVDQLNAAYELEQCAGWVGDKPAYAYAQKWKVDATATMAKLGFSANPAPNINPEFCAPWINTLRVKGAIQ
ncbi:hypothetical protein AH4AK4_2800 [Aeromonas hydrophila 4AK4]|nr:hypothetical protein AH4AK4_2800 [Aeromonas hydrophila 4AK4]